MSKIRILIEKHINIPVYATIPHSKKQDRIFKALQSEKSKARNSRDRQLRKMPPLRASGT